MKITKKQFLADVRHEIDMLKLHATDREKLKLNFNVFDPNSITQCIYGQMCNSCENPRASELIKKCCLRIIDKGWWGNDIRGHSFGGIRDLVNGEINEEMWESDGDRDFRYLSALEGYIMLKDAKHSGVISYIKGETDILTL